MRYTIDHDFIRSWVEATGGVPVFRTNLYNPRESHIEITWSSPIEGSPILWDEFFEWFEAENLAFGFPEEDSVDPRYFEFADRTDVLVDQSGIAPDVRRGKGDIFRRYRKWRYDKPHRDE